MDTEDSQRGGDSENLMKRVRNYLSRRASASSTAGSAVNSNKLSDSVLPKGVASTYSAILKNKLNTLCVPNLNGMDNSLASNIGTFFNEDNSRMLSAHFRTNYVKSWNVSFSFDPNTFTCTNCAKSPHRVAKMSEGGEDCPPRVFVVTDQSFPPVLPDLDESGCVSIIRIENGNLQELASIFLEMFKGVRVGVGSLVLLSSATHLAHAGAAAYAEDFVRASRLLTGGLGVSMEVRHGLPLLLEGSNDPFLLRSLHELGAWLGSLKRQGESFPTLAFGKMLAKLQAIDTTVFQPDLETRLKLPVALNSFEKSVWGLKLKNVPVSVKKLKKEAEEELLQALIYEIKSNHSIPLGENLSYERKPIATVVDSTQEKTFILVGASHASRLMAALEMSSATCLQITMPSYAPNKGTVERATLELEQAITEDRNAVVIMLMLDNAAYYARTEEGALIPARRNSEGSYHLDDELVVAPKEMFSSTLKICEPIFKAAEKAASAILLSPMPRYWSKSCCEDVEHAPNRNDEDFEQYLFSGLDGLV